MSVTVVIPWFGKPEWEQLTKRAVQSVLAQTVKPEICINKGENLFEARNNAKIETEYVIFLDADDTLAPNYVEHMLFAAEHIGGDVFVPSVTRHIGARVNTDQRPYIPRDLMTGNYIVIGAMIRTELFKKIGGWPDYPIYEDWAGYLRMEEEGAQFIQCPLAVYHIHVRPQSRNLHGDQQYRQHWNDKIIADTKVRRESIAAHIY